MNRSRVGLVRWQCSGGALDFGSLFLPAILAARFLHVPAAVLLVTLLLLPTVSRGHVGTLNVVYETQQPPVPLRVIIRPPGVVPGLADIDVRVLLTNVVKRVTVLPVHWRAGIEGAPPPDVAEPVKGEAGLYHAALWLMAPGAYSVHVNVETAGGTNRVIVPVNSLATSRLPMSSTLGGILIGLAVLLFLLAISIVGAAVRESVLPAGARPAARRRWGSRAAVAVFGVLLLAALERGQAWWNTKDREYRNNRMHHPVPCTGQVRFEGGLRVLQISVLTNDVRAPWPGLVPDHGKIMHVFLMREPELNALAHVHPVRRTHHLFEAVLPPLPPGAYRLYADVTHETGFSQTLTAPLDVPSLPEEVPATKAQGPRSVESIQADPDDSWFSGEPQPGRESGLGGSLVMKWEGTPGLVVGRAVSLRFRVLDEHGRLAMLDPYMNMLGHVAIRRDDGAVFTHLHPAGSVSLAAQQVFQIRAADRPPRRITPEMMEKLCQAPAGDLPQQPLSFPYEFPKPGRYRIWVQVKVAGQVRTGVFEAAVSEASKR